MGEYGRGFGFSGALAFAGIAAVAGMLGFAEWSRHRERIETEKSIAALKAEVAAARDESHAALSAVIDQKTLSRASESVYLIVVNGAPRGTAFVVDRDKGLLATAGHTAESLPLDDPKAEVYILNRGLRAPIKVTSKHIHAGFSAFRTLVESYQPTRKNSSIYAPQAAPVRDLAFDAALITVDAIDAASGANRLGPNLPLASDEKLLSLSGGLAIAIIGYPYDTLDDGFAADAAISRIDRGVIAAVMPPLDAAVEDLDPQIANLIIHRLSTAGGSSGSPVIDSVGEVVGIHTHGIESISSNADGGAQRADVLHDLLAPERETARVNQLFLPAWARTLTHWARTKDALPWSFYMEYARPGADPVPTVGDLAGADPPFFKVIEDLKFGDPVDSYRVAAPDAASAGTGAFQIDERGQYAQTWISVDRAQEAVLFAYDYSLRSRSGSCKLASYWRRKGETRLAAQKPRASFELRLEAEAQRTDEYHVVIRRDADCDPSSPDFFAGSIAWPAAAEIVAASYETPDRRVTRDGIYHAAQAALDRVACALDATPDEACEPVRYLDLESD